MDDQSLNAALVRRLHQRAIVSGSMVLPAVPGLLDEYVNMCDRVFMGIGVRFTHDELAELREIISGQLAEAFEASPRSDIVITYDAPTGLQVNYHVKAQWASIDAAYDHWISTREAPYFGTEPDARVWTLAMEAANPATAPILDVGAGTGRNALALARRGHPVDAVEMTAGFAEELRVASQRESLPVRVIEQNVFTPDIALRNDYEVMVLSEVASDFRSVDELRAVCELAARCLAPGGRLVMNIFLERDAYVPNDAARQLGQQCYTTLFTRDEVQSAVAGLPLELESDVSVMEFEREHVPDTAWPPTPWYERWISGQDVFEIEAQMSPIEMRWLVYRRER